MPRQAIIYIYILPSIWMKFVVSSLCHEEGVEIFVLQQRLIYSIREFSDIFMPLVMQIRFSDSSRIFCYFT